MGPEMRLTVEQIDVQIDATDEIAFYIRRTRWRVSESDELWED